MAGSGQGLGSCTRSPAPALTPDSEARRGCTARARHSPAGRGQSHPDDRPEDGAHVEVSPLPIYPRSSSTFSGKPPARVTPRLSDPPVSRRRRVLGKHPSGQVDLAPTRVKQKSFSFVTKPAVPPTHPEVRFQERKVVGYQVVSVVDCSLSLSLSRYPRYSLDTLDTIYAVALCQGKWVGIEWNPSTEEQVRPLNGYGGK